MNPTSQHSKGKGRPSLTGDFAGLGETGGVSHQRRANHRVDFVRKGTAISISHPGGSITHCMVSTQDLSSTGIRFRYGNYLHVGTAVVITLSRHRGGEEKVVGSVVRCQYVAGAGHDIGVKFKNPIFPQLFVEPAQCEQLYQPPVVKAEDLDGAVLLLDDQEMDRDLFEHLLKGTKVKLTSVATVEEALEAALFACDRNAAARG